MKKLIKFAIFAVAIIPTILNSSPQTDLFKGIKDLDLNLIKSAIEHGANVNQYDPETGRTVLVENLEEVKKADAERKSKLTAAGAVFTGLLTIGRIITVPLALEASKKDINTGKNFEEELKIRQAKLSIKSAPIAIPILALITSGLGYKLYSANQRFNKAKDITKFLLSVPGLIVDLYSAKLMENMSWLQE